MNVEQRSRTAETYLDIKGVDVKATLDAGADVLIVMLGMNDLLAPYVTERSEDLDHLTWQWQFSCALAGRDGDTLADLRYSPEPQR